jgi:tRNA-dihydrouridine synthase
MNFWQQLPKPFFALAPMDDVTDVVFRQVVAQAAAPDVFFTEFVSTDGLQSAGRASTLERLRLEPNLNRPLVAQIWGNDPDKYHASARDISAINERQAAAGAPAFAGIDINLGCPERGIVARGCCGGLIGHNSRVAELIAATKAGAPELPVSVKTRLGLGRIITEDWAGFLLTQDLAALTIHGRTVREMSKVPAHWDEIAKVAALRAQIAPHTVLLGNGDVDSRAQGETLAQTTGVDGIMIGRGIFKNPHLFAATPQPRGPQTLLQLLLSHLDLYEQWGSTKSYQTLKKFFKVYVNGWPGAADLRARLMDTGTTAEARAIVKMFDPASLKEYAGASSN